MPIISEHQESNGGPITMMQVCNEVGVFQWLSGKIDYNEKVLKLIEDALIAYLEPKNFLTKISYDKQINGKSNPFEIKNYKMTYKNCVLNFDYNIDLNYKIYDKNILNINIFDNENYFFMIFEEKTQLLNIPYKMTRKVGLNDVSFTINDPS